MGDTNLLQDLKGLKANLKIAFPHHTPQLFLGGDLKFLVACLLGMSCLNQDCCFWCVVQRKDWLCATAADIHKQQCPVNVCGASLFQEIEFSGIIYCLGHLLSNVVLSTVNILALLYTSMLANHKNFPRDQWVAAVKTHLPDWQLPDSVVRQRNEGMHVTVRFNTMSSLTPKRHTGNFGKKCNVLGLEQYDCTIWDCCICAGSLPFKQVLPLFKENDDGITPWASLREVMLEVHFCVQLPGTTRDAWNQFPQANIDNNGVTTNPIGLLWDIMYGVGRAIVCGQAMPWVDKHWIQTMDMLRTTVGCIPGAEKRFGLPFHILVGHFKAMIFLVLLPRLINQYTERCHRWDKRLSESMVSKVLGHLGLATFAHTALVRDVVLHKLYACKSIRNIPD